MSVNMVCAILNGYDNDCEPGTPGCNAAVSAQTFHNLEFWFTFVFNAVDLLALSFSPRMLSNRYNSPSLLKLLVLMNICMSFTAAMLVTLNLKKFEIPSHELEYANELIMTLYDTIILLNLINGRHKREETLCSGEQTISLVSLLTAGLVVCTQLGIYNLSGWEADGCSKGERPAHYLEFIFGAASAAVTFWFTMDNKFCAERRLQELMYGAGELV